LKVGKIDIDNNPATPSRYGVARHPHAHGLQGRRAREPDRGSSAEGQDRGSVRRLPVGPAAARAAPRRRGPTTLGERCARAAQPVDRRWAVLFRHLVTDHRLQRARLRYRMARRFGPLERASRRAECSDQPGRAAFSGVLGRGCTSRRSAAYAEGGWDARATRHGGRTASGRTHRTSPTRSRDRGRQRCGNERATHKLPAQSIGGALVTENAKLLYAGKEYILPVIEGTEHEKSIDIRKLRDATGLITLDSGYGNTGSTTSASRSSTVSAASCGTAATRSSSSPRSPTSSR